MSKKGSQKAPPPPKGQQSLASFFSAAPKAPPKKKEDDEIVIVEDQPAKRQKLEGGTPGASPALPTQPGPTPPTAAAAAAAAAASPSTLAKEAAGRGSTDARPSTSRPEASAAAAAAAAPGAGAAGSGSVAPTSGRGAAGAAGGARRGAIPPRDPKRHATMMKKLVTSTGWGGTLNREDRAERNAAFTFRALSEGGRRGAAARLTPLEQQVVDLKRRHPDVTLLVECGYKMRAFGEDAESVSRITNVYAYPDHSFLTCSFPVMRTHVYVRRLVEHGLKVGVVSQMETAALKSVGSNKSKPFERQLAAVYTRATLEAGELDERIGAGAASAAGAAEDGGGMDLGPQTASGGALNNYLLVVLEAGPGAGLGMTRLAAVGVETSTGEVLHGEFEDSEQRPALEGILLFLAPAEILLPPGVSRETGRLVERYKSREAAARVETTRDPKQYVDGGAIARLSRCFDSPSAAAAAAAAAGPSSPPPPEDDPDSISVLRSVTALPPLPAAALALAMDHLAAFGLDSVLRGAVLRPFEEAASLCLPANAMRQLDILQSSGGAGFGDAAARLGDRRGSLLWCMEQTVSPGGSRTMVRWVSRPLRSEREIAARLDAVEGLLGDQGLREGLHKLLSKVGDLERGLTRIGHATASPAELYGTLKVLGGAAGDARRLLAERPDLSSSSRLLSSLLEAASDPAVSAAASDALARLHEAACAAGDLTGVFACEKTFPAVFARIRAVQACRASLEALLPQYKKQLGLPGLQYVTVANQGDWMLEVPVESKAVPKDWEKVCGTKKVNRYWPPDVKKHRLDLQCEQERLELTAKDEWRRFSRDTASRAAPLRGAAASLSSLDALLSLSKVSDRPGHVRPEILSAEHPPTVEIRGGRHPVLEAVMEGPPVPNDVVLQGGGPRALIITGPNMGGKSCYMRLVAIIQIMAQIGCFVPADAARLTCCDAIFTRMGASDNLLMGSSTFHEELSEAAAILEKATPRSLVLMDELGRGTSTHDGLAIAHATLATLVTRNQALVLFTTHFQRVARELPSSLPGLVRCVRMDHAEQPPKSEGDPPTITFLYRAVDGITPRSFGLNVARLASLPASVVDCAEAVSREFEEETAERVKAAVAARIQSFVRSLKRAREAVTAVPEGEKGEEAGMEVEEGEGEGEGQGPEDLAGLQEDARAIEFDLETVLRAREGGRMAE